MTTDIMNTFDRQVLAAVRRLTSDSTGGVSAVDTMSLLDLNENGGAGYVKVNFPLAVDRLRSGGLLMSNPSGQLRLTSAGQREISQPDVAVDSVPRYERPEIL